MRHQPLVPWLRRMLKGRDEEIVWDEGEFFESGWDDWVDIQVKVIKAISAFGDAGAVDDIVEAIDDEYGQDLSEVAFAALARLGKPGTEALVRYATADEATLRRRAVTELGALDGVAASTTMSKALQDDDAEVRVAAGRAIARKDIKDKRLEMLLVDKMPEVRTAFIKVCGRHHPARLAALLFEKWPAVQSAVLDVLIAHPDAITEMGLKGRLLEILDAATPEPAALAAQALLKVFPDEMEAVVLERLGDTARPPEVRLGAIKAVAQSGSDAAQETLRAVLSDDDRQVRLAAMTAIAGRARTAENWRDEGGDVLLAALRGEVVLEPEVDEAAEADTENADKIAVVETVDAAQAMASPKLDDDQPPEIATDPNSTLGVILSPRPDGDAPSPENAEIELSEEDLEYMEMTRRTSRKKVVALDTDVAPHQDVRRFAARLLGDFAHAEVALELAAASTGADRELMLTALDSLAHVGATLGEYPAEVVETLLEKAEDPDQNTRLGVARALALAATDEAADRLELMLSDASSFVRLEAVRGLGNCQAVEACLSDEIPAVRLAAAEVLTPAAGPELTSRLVDFAFEFEAYHVRPVARLLRDKGDFAARDLFLDVLTDPARKRYWKSAIEALQELGHMETSDALAA